MRFCRSDVFLSHSLTHFIFECMLEIIFLEHFCYLTYTLSRINLSLLWVFGIWFSRSVQFFFFLFYFIQNFISPFCNNFRHGKKNFLFCAFLSLLHGFSVFLLFLVLFCACTYFVWASALFAAVGFSFTRAWMVVC